MNIIETRDITIIRPLFSEWHAKSNGEAFGVDMDLAVLIKSLQYLIDDGDASLLVAIDGNNKAIGWLCIVEMPSFMGKQKLANVTFWYASDGNMMAGPRLINAARQWAVDHRCHHLMLGASRLASDSHDSICRYCEKTGAKQLETIFVWECQECLKETYCGKNY